MSTSRVGAAPGVGWMLACSLWLLPVVFGVGLTSWIGLAVIGVLVVRIRWILLAGVQLWVLFQLPIDDLVDLPQRVLLGYLYPSDVPLLTLYGVSLAYALWANRVWLRVLWSRRERGQRMLGWAAPSAPASVPAVEPAPAVVPAAVPAVEPAAALSVERAPAPDPDAERAALEERAARAFHAVQRREEAALADAALHRTPLRETTLPQTTLPQTPLPQPTLPGILPHDPLDVRTASVDELAAIPAIGPARAALIVAARGVRPLETIDDVVELLELPAADLIRVRPYLTF